MKPTNSLEMGTPNFEAIQKIELPIRSRLYSLPPIRPGDAAVESLTSYIIRLSAAHCLPTATIVTRELAPQFRGQTLTQQGRHSDLFRNMGKAINGMAGTARETVEILQELTGRRDLGNLSMLPWSSLLAAKGLLRDYQAWCPACLQELRAGGKPLFYPLLWNLRAVTACPHHEAKLIDRCRQCSRPMEILHWNSSIGYCHRCHAPLDASAITGTTDFSVGGEHVAQKESQDARAAQELIMAPAEVIAQATPAHFARNVLRLASCESTPSMHKLSLALDVSAYTIRAWKNNADRPQLPLVLRLARLHNVSPVALLCGDIEGGPVAHRHASALQHDKELFGLPSTSVRRHDKLTIKVYLTTATKQQPKEAPSLRQLCRDIKADQGYVTQVFPALTQTIRARHRAHKTEMKEQRRIQIRVALRRAISALKADGINKPTSYQIRMRLECPHWVREKWVQEELPALLKSSDDDSPVPTGRVHFAPQQQLQLDFVFDSNI